MAQFKKFILTIFRKKFILTIFRRVIGVKKQLDFSQDIYYFLIYLINIHRTYIINWDINRAILSCTMSPKSSSISHSARYFRLLCTCK